MKNYAELLFINNVRDLQNEVGTGDMYAKLYPQRTQESLSEHDKLFISLRQSFYIATVSSSGWPYIQHRGGPVGFLKVIDENTIGFADYTGNKQFITMGHAAQNSKASFFLMDYENKARLKIMGRLEMRHVKDADPTLCEFLNTQGQGHVDRISTLKVEAMDWNCPKYIPHFVSAEKFLSPMQALLDENEALKKELKQLKGDS